MARRSFEIWVNAAPVVDLLKLRDVYIQHMTLMRLRNRPLEPWLTENLKLINERLATLVRAPEGLDPVHPAAGADV
jgi:hypothetical protein